ncbi:MAG: DUF4349 domain-containing protein [Dehalococcoidales bacterium]|nr:DUF4349 domain-containing protein [Dehalococcoidales bacterium]
MRTSKILLLIPIILLVVSCSAAPRATETAPSGSRGEATTPPREAPTVPSPAGIPSLPTTTPPAIPQISGDIAQQAQDITARLIVRNGSMLIMVDDIKNAVAQITTLTEQKKGFVVSSQIPPIEQGSTGSIVIRVPADEFENAMSAISGFAQEVKSQSTSANDVMQQYTDLNSRLNNLLATEQQFLVILGKATTVTDILSVQRELQKTREDIEVTKGQIQYLEQTSSTSLITITLQQSKLIVKFTPERPLVDVDETISFRADITGGFSPFSYEWNFGDKVTSNKQVPTHSYATAADRKVTLKVTDSHGNVATDERTVTVTGGWSGNSVARTAWRALSMSGRVVLNVLIWVGIFSPVWLTIGGIVIFFRWRSRRKKSTA